MDRGIEIAGLRDRALEQESYHVEVRLTHELYHLRRQEVSVLFEEAVCLVDDSTGKVMDGEAYRIGLGSHIELGLDVAVELF